MKKKLSYFICLYCLAVLCCFSVKAQSIYTYANATNGAYASLNANLTATNLTTVGSWGSNSPCSNGGGMSGITVSTSFSTFNPANVNSPALNVNITPNAGYMIKLTSISVSLRRSGTGPSKARLAYSIDGGLTWVNNGSDLSPHNGSCGSFSTSSWTLSSPLYVCAGLLKVRVYYFAPSSSSGTCQTANLVLNGTVTPILVPSLSIVTNAVPPVCAGSGITFTAVPVNPGISPVYTWLKNGVVVGNNTTSYTDNTLSSTDVIECKMSNIQPCSSVDTVTSNSLGIDINPVIASSVTDTVCYGTPLAWGAQTLTASGIYTQVFSSAAGCDSTVTMNFFVRPQNNYAFADTACYGDSYTWGAQTVYASGGYSQTFTSSLGCDSTVLLSLYVRPEITYTFADTICFGQVYSWQSLTLNSTGNYLQTFPSFTGCDSTVTLHLFVRPAITHSLADTICALSSYNWAGQSFNTAGTYSHTFPSFTGCDSVVTLNLFVRPAITHSFVDTICALSNYNWAGQLFNTTGIYNHTFTSFTGCDSIVTLHLFVRPAITHSFADTICALSSYNWAGQSFNTTGIYNHIFTSFTGCDSMVTLNLFVRPAITHSFADTICASSSYNWAGQSFNITGTYNHTFTSFAGCDSTVTLNLFVRPAITHSFADTICASSNYNWAGQSFNATGTYNHTFTSFAGCDSTVTLNLFVRPAINHSFADTICASSSYNWAGQSFNTTGTYNHTFTSFTGCDSVVTLQLYVYPEMLDTLNQTICSGTTFSFGGQILNVGGIYNHTFLAVSGCDSNVTLILNVTPTITNTVAATICYGDVYSWGTQTYNASGIYSQTFVAASSCDSVVSLTLTVSPQITDTISDTICYGTTYVLGSQVLNTSGFYSEIFTAASGCDSIANLYLTVNPQNETNISAAICNGQNYTLGSQNLNASGNYTEIFSAVNGCDSIVHLNLNVSAVPYDVVIDTASCGSLIFEGVNYTSSVLLTDTFFTSLGCDSAYRHVNISVYNNVPIVTVIDTFGCNSLVFEGTVYTSSTTFNDTLQNILGCDSLVREIHITVGESEAYDVEEQICAGQSFAYNGQHISESGTYSFTFKNRQGCDSVVNINLLVNPLPFVRLTDADNISHCVGDSVTLNLSGAYSYELTAGYGYLDNDKGRALLIDHNNRIAISGTDGNGCSNVDSVDIVAQDCCNIWMPNAFSPNGDGVNDIFKPETKGHPKEYVLRIFDRWGQNVFTSYKVEEGWDGTIKGKSAALDTYHYFISGKCTSGDPINMRGIATLVR